MAPVLTQYLETVKDNLRLTPEEELDIINELETHIQDEVQELKQAGLSEEEATHTCLRLLGSARVIARQIYEAHSQRHWKQALLAAAPHLIYGMLFVLNWWQYIGWGTIMLLVVLSIALYGLWRGRPTWVFPWLGYTLVPVIMAGILLLYLPRGWYWMAVPIYMFLTSWWVYYIVEQTLRSDWLFSSLMLLPVPIVTGWVLAIRPWTGAVAEIFDRIYDFAPAIAVSFLTLSLTIVSFFRVRQRWLRAALLIMSGLLALAMIAYYTEGQLSIPAFSVLVLAMVGLFLVPAFLERRIRKGSRKFTESVVAE